MTHLSNCDSPAPFLAGVVPNPIEIIVRLIELNPMKHHLLGFILLNGDKNPYGG